MLMVISAKANAANVALTANTLFWKPLFKWTEVWIERLLQLIFNDNKQVKAEWSSATFPGRACPDSTTS